jgi:hypothetical protein
VATTRSITNDLWSLQTVAMRLTWQHGLVANGTLDHTSWNLYASADVNTFLVEARSLYDHLAKIIEAIALKREMRDQSYHDLVKKVRKDRARLNRLFGPDVVEIIDASAECFLGLRELRDRVVHRDHEQIAFYEPDHISCAVSPPPQHLRRVAWWLLGNDGAFDFRLMAGALFGRAHALLERLSPIATARLKLQFPGIPGSAQMAHTGLEPMRAWVEAALRATAR